MDNNNNNNMSNEFADLYKLVMKTKANLLLQNARTRCQYFVNDDIKNTYGIDTNQVVLHEITKKMSDLIINTTRNNIKIINDHNGEKHSLDLMVLPTEMFKDVIEVFIENMTVEQFMNIKNKKI